MSVDLKTALITGGSGMVGSRVPFGFKPSSAQMDICDPRSVDAYVKQLPAISCVVHFAAINLRDSESSPCKAIDVNVNGTTNMLSVAKARGVPFVFLSTGAVFSSKDPAAEFDEECGVCPNSVYGWTKAAGELVALLYEKTILLRTGWLFGGTQKTHYKFVELVINNLITKTEIKGSSDFYGSPTYVEDLLERMYALLQERRYGIFHVVNHGFASGFEIAREVASALQLSDRLITNVASTQVPNAGPFRSSSERLSTLHDSVRMRSWQEALAEYARAYYRSKTGTAAKTWCNRTQCRLCDSFNVNVFFHLNPTPPANHFVLEPAMQEAIPLDVALCTDCRHVQLMQVVDPSFLYSNYLYVSSTSSTMTDHLQRAVLRFVRELGVSPDDHVLEIGANDGVCVKQLLDHGFKNVLGVDPAENIKRRHTLPILCDYFGSALLPKLQGKKFKLVYAFHCCAHIEGIQDVFSTLRDILQDDGTFVMEVGYFYDVFVHNCFDTIYHEHIDYHTCTALSVFASKYGMTLYRVERNTIQGGSIQCYLTKRRDAHVEDSVRDCVQLERALDATALSKWKIKVMKCGIDMNLILSGMKHAGKKIIGYGASAKSTTFLHQYKITRDLLDYIVDDNIYKQNYYSPGLHIPVRSSHALHVDPVDYIVILSWNFTEEIVKKLEPVRQTGVRIIIPFPEIKIV
jgi:dTDP-4-dehydrorhamnose reductase